MERIKLTISILEDILEKVLDDDRARVVVGEMLKEQYMKLSSLTPAVAKRSSSPCPCGCS